jgi:hypothetical protein
MDSSCIGGGGRSLIDGTGTSSCRRHIKADAAMMPTSVVFKIIVTRAEGATGLLTNFASPEQLIREFLFNACSNR